MPTPRATDGTKGGPNQRGSSGDLMLPSAVALLPTPDANADKYRINGDSQQSKSLAGMARREEISPARHSRPHICDSGIGYHPDRRWPCNTLALLSENHALRWGDYAAAIARWEHVLGRPAPAPTQTSAKGNPQLSPAFVEWLMGLPAGWVTDVPGITRNEALKALGNGVVWQQAEAAIRFLLTHIEVAA
jgi:DNA (cytosine-5)-methyltransferase 1